MCSFSHNAKYNFNGPRNIKGNKNNPPDQLSKRFGLTEWSGGVTPYTPMCAPLHTFNQ